MADFTERCAEPSDHDFSREVHHAAYRDIVERQFGAWDIARQDAFFEAGWRPALTNILVLGGIACGYRVVEERPDELRLHELVIHPRYQGHGLGTAVLRRLMARAAERSLPLRLQVLRHNRARVLYERVGFQECGSTPTHLLMEWSPPKGPI